MSLLPIFLKLDGRRGLVVGAGSVALEKIRSLLPTGLRINVVAPEAIPEIRQLAAQGQIELIERPFESADMDGSFIIIAATNNPTVNAAVYQGAVARCILANSVDDPPNCDFYFGSVVSRGNLQIAISTAGESPAVSQRLRREIDQQLPQDLGPWLEEVGRLRREILATQPAGEARKQLLHELAQRPACAAPFCPTRKTAPSSSGKVYLIGAGPGDPELLTVKALRLLQAADVLLHDDLVPRAILELAAPPAEVVNVGKRCGVKFVTQQEINARMIEQARAGRAVVRLKSGDPLLFGRAAEEIAALAEAAVPFEIVPGITAAFAAAAALGCSLTSRTSASSVVLSTGHHAQPADDLPHEKQATRVVYMPGRDLSLLAQDWLAEGLPADLPCAVVSHAGQPEEQIHRTTLGALGDTPPAPAPSLLIAGWALRESSVAIAPEGRCENSPEWSAAQPGNDRTSKDCAP